MVYEMTGELVPQEVYDSIETNKIVLKGPITTPIGTGFRSINVALRKKYDLYSKQQVTYYILTLVRVQFKPLGFSR